MNFPSELLYTKDHEWMRVEGGIAVVGITDFAQKELGDIVYVDINTVGETLDGEAVFGTIEAVKAVSDLYLPAAGEVMEKNSKLDSNPELVNQDPYGEGWLVKIKLAANFKPESLMGSEAYQATLSL